MTNKNFHMKYGLIAGLVIIALNMILYLTNLSFERWTQYVAFAPLFIGAIWCCIAFANANNNEVTFGNVFSTGFKATAIVAIIMFVWSVICIFAFPEMKDKALEKISEQMAAKGTSEEIMDKSLEITRKGWNYFVVMGAVFFTLFYGAIASLIGAIVAKKKPPMQNIQA